MDKPDLAWVAGFLEGEGSFGCYQGGQRLAIQAAQVQRWPLEKLHSLIGGNLRGPYTSTRDAFNRKPTWHWSHDRGPQTLEYMLALRPLMSPNRQEQIDRAIAAYQSIPHPGRGHWLRPRRLGPRIGRRIVAAAMGALVLTAGCAVVTKPTGQITMDRQSFVDAYALAKAIYLKAAVRVEALCAAELMPAERCQAAADTQAAAKRLDLEVQAKLLVPESEINWAVILRMLEFAAGVVL